MTPPLRRFAVVYRASSLWTTPRGQPSFIGRAAVVAAAAAAGGDVSRASRGQPNVVLVAKGARSAGTGAMGVRVAGDAISAFVLLAGGWEAATLRSRFACWELCKIRCINVPGQSIIIPRGSVHRRSSIII